MDRRIFLIMQYQIKKKMAHKRYMHMQCKATQKKN